MVRSNGMATALSQAAEYGARGRRARQGDGVETSGGCVRRRGDDDRGSGTSVRFVARALELRGRAIESGRGGGGLGASARRRRCTTRRSTCTSARVGTACESRGRFGIVSIRLGVQSDELRAVSAPNERTRRRGDGGGARRRSCATRRASPRARSNLSTPSATSIKHKPRSRCARTRRTPNITPRRRYVARERTLRAALRADAADLDATVGVGETMMSYAAILRRRGDAESARAAYADAWRAYERALARRRPPPAACEERFAIVYNAACAANRTGDVIRARQLIHGLLLCGFTSRDVVDADDDLRADAAFVSRDA